MILPTVGAPGIGICYRDHDKVLQYYIHGLLKGAIP